MKKHTLARILSAGAVAALCAFGVFAMSGCSSTEEETADVLESDTGLTGGTAATVNGVEIEEDKVTRAINNMRLNYNYTEESEWKDYLKNRKYTVESMRYEVVGEFIDQELVKQCAGQLGISTDDEEIQSYVNKMSEQYSSEEAWLQAVEDSGWENGVDGYKEALNFSILEKKLKDHFNAEAEAALEDEDALVEELQKNSSTYSGAKKSSHILFSSEDEQLANEVREKILNGEISFEDAVAEYSTDDTSKEDGGNVGWDKTNTFVTEYTDALANLQNIGDISEVTKSKYGYHIIELTDVWTAPETITSSSDMPEEFVTSIRTSAVETNGTTAYDDWLDSMHPANDVQVNPIPENVPYWVDMSDVYSEEEAAEITQEGLDKLIKGTAAVEEEATAAEAEADASSTDAAADASATDAAADATSDATTGADAGAEAPADDAATTDEGAADAGAAAGEDAAAEGEAE